MQPRLIVSLFDHSGNWSQPYLDAGYHVIRVDLQEGLDVLTFKSPRKPWGVLAAPPCEIWSNVRASTWNNVPPEEFEHHKAMALAAVRICRSAKKFWALENPAGRLGTIIGPHSYWFHPFHFGDPWTKRTWLWGSFNPPPRTPCIAHGSLIWGGTRSKAKTYPLFNAVAHCLEKPPKKFTDPTALAARYNTRSATPPGFARAFFNANP